MSSDSCEFTVNWDDQIAKQRKIIIGVQFNSSFICSNSTYLEYI